MTLKSALRRKGHRNSKPVLRALMASAGVYGPRAGHHRDEHHRLALGQLGWPAARRRAHAPAARGEDHTAVSTVGSSRALIACSKRIRIRSQLNFYQFGTRTCTIRCSVIVVCGWMALRSSASFASSFFPGLII